MPRNTADLRKQTDSALSEGRAIDAVCYLAELVTLSPDDRNARTALALALGDAGHPVGALRVLRALAEHLAHTGLLLPAMVAVRHGLEHAPQDSGLLATVEHLRRLAAPAPAGAKPPALKAHGPSSTLNADELLALPQAERLERVTQLGCEYPGTEAIAPSPLPLFASLDAQSMVDVVRTLRYRRVARGAAVIDPSQAALAMVITGHVLARQGQHASHLGPGAVLGENALVAEAAHGLQAEAEDDVELFELTRGDLEALGRSSPKAAEAVVAYCRKRLIGALLQSSPLFNRFDENTRGSLLEHFKRVAFDSGDTLVGAGAPSPGLYVIVTGQVDVSDLDAKPQAHLGPGDVMGEASLVHDAAASTTAKASGRVGALFLPKDEFQAVLAHHPDVKKYLEGVRPEQLQVAANSVEDISNSDDLVVL